MERPRAPKESAGPPQGSLKHLEAPSRASLETSLGRRGSAGTVQERSRDSLKGPKCQKKVAKAYQRPTRRSLEAQEDRQRHESGPPSFKGRSKPAKLQPEVPSVIPSSLSQTGPPSIEASKPPVASAGYAKRKQFEFLLRGDASSHCYFLWHLACRTQASDLSQDS